MIDQPIFYTNGALPSTYPYYVWRRADQLAIRAFDRGKLIYTIAPRQMGKTSLLKRLLARLENQGWHCCFVDLASMTNLELPRWFRHLGEQIARTCKIKAIVSPLQDQQDFGTFLLNEVGLGLQGNSTRLALFLDEVEGLFGLNFSDEFLMKLRDIYQQRDSYPGKLLIAFAGAIDPESLIKGPSSPFNIADEILLDDFTAEECLTLTSNLSRLGIPVVEAVHDHIYNWTSGQPYLAQRICETLEAWAENHQILGVSTDIVDKVVHTELLAPRNRDKNVKHVLGEVAQLKSFSADLWNRLLAGEQVNSTAPGFYPLYLTGAVTENAEGQISIRNQIYSEVLSIHHPTRDGGGKIGSTGSTKSNSKERKLAHFPELAEALQRHTLTLFIGADLPSEITGLPSRADLARNLARRYNLDESLSLAEVAQRISQIGNRLAFTSFIRDALDTTGRLPESFHQHIVDLVADNQIGTLITTAYDHLLELAFQTASVGINHVVRESDLPFIRSDRPTLIKLYGEAQQPDTLVVTDHDHSNLLANRDKAELLEEVRRVFRRSTVLFLGYNFADPDFRSLFNQIMENRFAHIAYGVYPGLQEVDVRMWRDRGIIILNEDPLGVLSLVC